VKPSNARELMSAAERRRCAGRRRELKADEFLAIASVYR
jgi:hypothetical protein